MIDRWDRGGHFAVMYMLATAAPREWRCVDAHSMGNLMPGVTSVVPYVTERLESVAGDVSGGVWDMTWAQRPATTTEN